MAKVAFVGLGVMGFPMAGHLANSGHEVKVYNRSDAKAGSWSKKFGGTACATPREAVEGVEFAMSCVGNDDDVRSIAHGDDGIIAGLDSGSVYIDHTTASAGLARELGDACRDRGAGFIDGPVSGGQAGAENGVLTIMCGGSSEAFERAQPVMQAYGRAVTLMGEIGAGQLTKMVNQICIAGLLQGLSEAANFAVEAGLDTDKVVDVISKGAAQSWQMENRWKTMVKGEFEFGFAVDWMRKDLRIVLEEARDNGAPLPITAAVDQLYRLVQQKGGSRWDTSSLITNLSDR